MPTEQTAAESSGSSLQWWDGVSNKKSSLECKLNFWAISCGNMYRVVLIHHPNGFRCVTWLNYSCRYHGFYLKSICAKLCIHVHIYRVYVVLFSPSKL